MPPPGGTSSELIRRGTRHATPPPPHDSTSPLSAPPRRAQTRKINPVTTSGAQCYPRLACALNGSLLMQVHQEPRAAPALMLAVKSWNKKRMQTHAPDACAGKKRKTPEKLNKKPAIRVPVSVGFYRDYWPRNAPITLLRHMLATISRKIVVHGFS